MRYPGKYIVGITIFATYSHNFIKMKIPVSLAFIILLIGACKEKDDPKDLSDPAAFFPVVSFLKSQVAHVDTSLYSIIKVITIDSVSDTSFIPREEFRKEAEDFINMPDLTDKKKGKYYKEEKMYEETLGRVILTYLPRKENGDILRQEVVIMPGFGAEDKVKSIIVERKRTTRDSSILKRLLWQVDQSFQVVSIIEKTDGSGTIIRKEVIWNPLVEEQVFENGDEKQKDTIVNKNKKRGE